MRHLGNFALGAAVDILRGYLGSRDGKAVLDGVREARRSIEVGQKIGQHREVLDGPGSLADSDAAGKEALRAREAQLTAELEAIREQRGG